MWQNQVSPEERVAEIIRHHVSKFAFGDGEYPPQTKHWFTAGNTVSLTLAGDQAYWTIHIARKSVRYSDNIRMMTAWNESRASLPQLSVG